MKHVIFRRSWMTPDSGKLYSTRFPPIVHDWKSKIHKERKKPLQHVVLIIETNPWRLFRIVRFLSRIPETNVAIPIYFYDFGLYLGTLTPELSRLKCFVVQRLENYFELFPRMKKVNKNNDRSNKVDLWDKITSTTTFS